MADLHIHSCLSSCAELEMTPRAIVGKARELGLDIIALTDHNSARNAEVTVELGRREGLLVLPGMEVCSSEEAHVLALFGSLDDALSMQQEVYAGLARIDAAPLRWQVVVDAEDNVMEFEEAGLLGASAMGLGELVRRIKALGGLAIASHLDREAFSVMSQLGFVPADVIFDAVEVIEPERAKDGLIFHRHLPMLAFSDAHRLADMGRRATAFMMQGPGFDELRMALRGEDGRGVRPIFGRDLENRGAGGPVAP